MPHALQCQAPERTAPKNAPSRAQSPSMEEDGADEQSKAVVDNASEDEDTNSDHEKRCLAAYCQRGRVGCAYYDPVECILYVMEDTQDSGHYDLTRMILTQANPTIVLTSSNAEDIFIDVLRQHVDMIGAKFQIRPHKDFQPTKGKERILSLPLMSGFSQLNDPDTTSSECDSEARHAYNSMKGRSGTREDPSTNRRNASIRLSNFASSDSAPLCMSSAGALLDHLVRESAVADLEDKGISGLLIRDIEALALEEVMHVNADALLSLHIFRDDSHASIHSDRAQEGLSLFGTLDHTRTVLGRALLRTWLLRPSLSLSVITDRHDAVECFLDPENLVSASGIQSHLKGIKNIPKILGTMKRGNVKLSDWQGLMKFTFHVVMLWDNLHKIRDVGKVKIISKIMTSIDVAQLRELGVVVNKTIDWDESVIAGRVCVAPHIDKDLDHRKHVYNGLGNILSAVAEQICHTVPVEYACLNIVYFPQLGFLICVPMLDEWKSETGIGVLEGWSFQFSSATHAYFKSQEMCDMDTHIGDLHSLVVDQEIEIVQDLLEQVLVLEQTIGQACDACAELDCLLSFTEAAQIHNYKRPSMVEGKVVNIVQGRHPVQEQVVETFVPNDACLATSLDEDQTTSFLSSEADTGKGGTILLCTGANACGKTVYLKQIALIQFMAQIGSFVPAEEATLGVVDKIFTCMQTQESVSKIQSAFMIDLNQVSLALRNATARSLILLDEFGKGTISTDGAGLLCGVLKSLLARGSECPKVLVATHLHEIFRQDLLDPARVPIIFVHMQVMFTTDGGDLIDERKVVDDPVRPGESLTYLYKMANGISLVSHAAKCAQVFGIPPSLVEYGERVSRLSSMNELGQLLDEDMKEEEVSALEVCENICRRFLKWDLEGCEEHEDARDKVGKLLEKPVDVVNRE